MPHRFRLQAAHSEQHQADAEPVAYTHLDVYKRQRMRFALELAEDRFGDVVVAAPVGGAFGVRELVHVVATGLLRQCLGLGVDPVSYTHLDVYKRQALRRVCDLSDLR